MYNPWINSESRMDVARRILSGFMDTIAGTPNIEIALRIYGHQTTYAQHDCFDSKLEVPFDRPKINSQRIKDKLSGLRPTGTTPIAYSLEKSADDFTPCTNCKNVIILITDGVEECDGDPCAVSMALRKRNVFLRPFIIGISNIDGFVDAFSCIGKFYNVNNPANFVTVLKNIMTEAVSQTTAQVNLNDIAKKPIETDVAMTFYDEKHGGIKYNFVHTLNHRGLPDTLILNPDNTYKLVVHTIPPVEKSEIKLQKGKHNTIVLDAPQGNLRFQTSGDFREEPIQAIIRKSADMKTLNVQTFGTSEKYLVGKYDVEILTLPRIKQSNVEITQSAEKIITIPGSGMVSVEKRSICYGSLYVEETGKFTWIYNLNPELRSEVFYLQPGNYRIEYREKDKTDIEKTIEKKFSVKSGQTQSIKLFQ